MKWKTRVFKNLVRIGLQAKSKAWLWDSVTKFGLVIVGIITIHQIMASQLTQICKKINIFHFHFHQLTLLGDFGEKIKMNLLIWVLLISMRLKVCGTNHTLFKKVSGNLNWKMGILLSSRKRLIITGLLLNLTNPKKEFPSFGWVHAMKIAWVEWFFGIKMKFLSVNVVALALKIIGLTIRAIWTVARQLNLPKTKDFLALKAYRILTQIKLSRSKQLFCNFQSETMF